MPHRSLTVWLLGGLLASCTPDVPAQDDTDTPGDTTPELPPPPCVPEPPAELMAYTGEQKDGSFFTLEGRRAVALGDSTRLEGFGTDLALHPTLPVAYVSSVSQDDQRLIAVDLDTGAVLQDLNRGEAFYGLAVSPDGTHLTASGGRGDRVQRYTLDAAGIATLDRSIDVPGRPAGLDLSPDAQTAWVATFSGRDLHELDLASGTLTRTVDLGAPGWHTLHLPARGEVWVSSLTESQVVVVDEASFTVVARIEVGKGAAGMVASADGSAVYVAVSTDSAVVQVDTTTRTLTAQASASVGNLVNDAGEPLSGTNADNISLSPDGQTVYLTRAADNMVGLFEAKGLKRLGTIPTRWYPTASAVRTTAAGTEQLVVLEGKGSGSGPNPTTGGAKDLMASTLSRTDLATVDLAAATAIAEANHRRPADLFDVVCEGDFPIPTRPDQVSPIEHVILIVKENKTFDSLLGSLELDVAKDETLLRWGEDITPNGFALARTFALADNFYTNTQNSDSGHTWLTAAGMTAYAERLWATENRGSGQPLFPISPASVPRDGNVFSHLYDHGVDVRIFGEVVGAQAPLADGRTSFELIDTRFPGGPIVNYGVPDEEKARYVAEQIAAGDLAQFTYLLLPNDHTNGTAPDVPTPESMVADNDYAVGLVIDALSHSPFWDKSAVFVLQDDPQSGKDHIDAHRSPLWVASPWAKRGHISHVHGSFSSVYATIFRIFGAGPLGRRDAAAAPLWDMFTATPDSTPYTAVPRTFPPTLNGEDLPGAAISQQMDFSSADRSPELSIVLDAYRLWRMGRIDRQAADTMVLQAEQDARWEELEEEAEEDSHAFDLAWKTWSDWQVARGNPRPDRPPAHPIYTPGWLDPAHPTPQTPATAPATGSPFAAPETP